jgi:hypothetical protein
VKYYIEYPIPIQCGLRCPYCFHQPLWEFNERYPDSAYGDKCAFTFAQYEAWRNKHLADGTEFLMELHGGEMSYKGNQRIVLDIIDSADKERFQLQTNGLGDAHFYQQLNERRKKIDSVGFTFHRKEIYKNSEAAPHLTDRFKTSVLARAANGIKVYVKELLFLDCKEEILKNKEYWESQGVEFRLQDFKGVGGLCTTEKYTAEDWALIHPEYRHGGPCCHCREGYKQLIIRGYDQHGGDVLACWQDHKVVGSIVEDWYEPYEKIVVDTTAPRGRTVVGKGVYRGDYMRDLKRNALEKIYHKIYPKESKMLAKAVESINQKLSAFVAEHQRTDEAIRSRQAQISQLTQEISDLSLYRAELAGQLKLGSEILPMLQEAVPPQAPVSAQKGG